jgi:hypothetical protein
LNGRIVASTSTNKFAAHLSAREGSFIAWWKEVPVETSAGRSKQGKLTSAIGKYALGQLRQRLDHNQSSVIRCYGSHSLLALLHPTKVLAQARFPRKGRNITSSRFGLSPPTGYNLFTLQAVEFTPSRQQAAAEMANQAWRL